MALTRTAKSCGSDAPMLASSLRERSADDGVKQAGHRGEHEGNRKTIARGMPGDFRCDRGDYARVLTSLIAREASGALGTRHSLRPLFSKGECFCKNSDASRREIAEVCREIRTRHPQC